jgi:hypothetical protein
MEFQHKEVAFHKIYEELKVYVASSIVSCTFFVCFKFASEIKLTYYYLNRYRYTLDELATLLGAVKARAECYDQWVDKVKAALAAKDDDRLEFSELKELLEEANERKYPLSDLFEGLTLTVEEAEKCQTVANQLGSKKVKSLIKNEFI